MTDTPGSARLVLVEGVSHLNEELAVFEAMLTGWSRQQRSRMLGEDTVAGRERLVRRFAEFAESYPWGWGPGDVEDFTVSLTSGKDRLSISTIRSYHLTLRLFCDYLTDARYEWAKVCRDRFAQVPTQVCHEWNTVAHLNEYEGQPQRRPLDLRRGPDALRLPRRPGGVDRSRGQEGLARRVARRHDVEEHLRVRAAPQRAVPPRRGRPAPQPPRRRLGPLRIGPRALRQGAARRPAAPAHRGDGARVRLDRERAGPMDRRRPAALRCGGPSRFVGDRAAHPCGATPYRPALRSDQSRDRARREPQPALPAPLLRDASDRVRLPRALRPGPGRARVCVDHRHLHLGQRRLQEPDPKERARGASYPPDKEQP